MNLFEIILSPFIYIIKQIFLLSYSLTGNYGWSIILLSFFISLLLLPVFILIEKAKKKNDAIRQKMKPLEDEIKHSYKGQERYYYLKTLNRQHHFSPFKAMIPILSLLLQIPFFIAAYQFLENFQALEGISFWFIDDLSAPDALFGKIHFLPIAMTLVNLITAFFYTRFGSKKERNQMVVVAGIFLVLLFNLPSGLVLYWTMNNVFSFFRLFVTNREVFKKHKKLNQKSESWLQKNKDYVRILKPRLLATFIVISSMAVLTQLNWSLGHGFYLLHIRILSAIGIAALITIFAGILTILHIVKNDFTFKPTKENFNSLWNTFKPLFFVITGFALVSQITWAFEHNFNTFILRMILAIFASFLITCLLAFVAIIYQIPPRTHKPVFLSNLIPQKKWLQYLFFIFVALIIILEVKWGIKHSFRNFILRIGLSALMSYILFLSIYYFSIIINEIFRAGLKRLSEFFKLQKADLGAFLFVAIFTTSALQYRWALHHGFGNFGIRLLLTALVVSILTFILFAILSHKSFRKLFEIKPGNHLFYISIFLSVYFYLSSKYYYSGQNILLEYLTLLFTFVSQLFAYTYLRNNNSKLNKYFRFILGLMLVAFITIQFAYLWAYISKKEFNLTIFNILFSFPLANKLDVALPGIIFSILVIPFSRTYDTLVNISFLRPNFPVYLLSVFYLSGFILLWNPVSVYSTFPANFEFPAIDILKNNFSLFATWFLASIAIYFLIPKKYRGIWFFIILGFSVIAFVHNTIAPIKVGTLQEGKYNQQDNLAQPVYNFILEAILFLFIFYLLRWILKKKFFKQLIIGYALINSILISQSLTAGIKTGVFFKKPEISADIDNAISFSKDKQNVVLMVLDMFHGWYMDKILKNDPKIKNEFEGFTWYPNTLSVSSITYSSLAAILSNFKYTPGVINKENVTTLGDKMSAITKDFYNKVKSHGYQFTATRLIYSDIDKNKYDTYLPPWDEEWDVWNPKLNIGVSVEIGYTVLWENALFYSAPLFLKSKIYDKGKWFHGDVKTNENTTAAQPYNFLRLLPFISDTKTDKPNFIYIHSMATHKPWDVINNNGEMITDVTPYENNNWAIHTLTRWIDWMKKNKVYDNTKIILISDHGPHWMHFKGGVDMDIPLTQNPELNVRNEVPLTLFPLLMVKDFNQKNILKKDNRFMSNADALSIAFDKENPTTIEPPKHRTLPTSMVVWERKLWLKNKIPIEYMFEVQDSAFDMHKWKRIK